MPLPRVTVVVVGLIDSRRGVHNVELFSWEQPGSSQCNGKCKDLPLQQQGCVSFNFLWESLQPPQSKQVTQLLRSPQAEGFPSVPWGPAHCLGQQRWHPSSLKLCHTAASDGRLLGTFSRVWVHQRRAPSMLITLPVKSDRLQQRRKVPYSILGGQGRIFAAWRSYSTCFQSLHTNAPLCTRLEFDFAETVQYSALQVKSV